MAPQREWFEKDYYKVLGVSPNASEKEITRAYRRLAKQYHPDAHPGSEDRFKEISAAYDVLGDAEKRKEYDQVRSLGGLRGGFAGAGTGGGTGPAGFGFRVEDFSDLLGGLFGRQSRTSSSGAGVGTHPRRGDDLEAELHLTFAEAVHGVTTSVNVTSDVPCRSCRGSGAAPGTAPTVCKTCGGRGTTDDNQGLFSLSQPCPVCGGRGLVVEHPCPTCHGTGVERRARQVRLRVPPGVEDGSRIRLKGRGAAGRGGGPAGDLYVRIHVAPHPLFTRRGRDLAITVPVLFSEAALGATIDVPTLDGLVTLRIPPGTPSGRTFRIRGRGVAGDGRLPPGDLLATIEVAVPEKLDDTQRQAVEALASVLGESPRRWSS